ncbi:MAG: histidine--tRNA ligase [Actinomycetia bacterium]|nr:histidine--tRNA ligase [Actinomycetes bacterium]MCH9800143.1 histidine--tRNA ligase [Actinomycetes bacterium]
MSGQFAAPKGVPEYVPPGSAEFLAVREGLAEQARLAGYRYIELPVFEDYGLFARGVGESTDVVSKEMYTFTDRGDRTLALRPEGTAGVIRSVIQHGLHRGQLPVKLYYAGPFFRAERPQKGRYRQLQQVGIEAVGSDDPALDAEVIAVADHGFRSLGLSKYRLLLNSLGCANCRPRYRQALTDFLAGLDLDEATRERAALNPLRVLDDKREAVQEQLTGAPLMIEHLCDECQEHYDDVREHLRGYGISWQEEPRLVRGLDYYTRTTFEFSHDLLGAQSGIGGGGRYDGLMAQLGGSDLPGIGFGIGTDRTLLAREAEGLAPLALPAIAVFAVGLGESARRSLTPIIDQLRRDGIATDQSYGGRGLKGAMKAADRSGASWAMIMGDDEAAAGTVQLKNLSTGEQTEVPATEVVTFLSTN